MDWHGASGDGADYRRACGPLDADVDLRGHQLRLAGGDVVVWDMPTGTADVWRRGEFAIELTWSWLDDWSLQARAELAGVPRAGSIEVGRLPVSSGWLVVMWAADAGEELAAFGPSPALALDLSVGGSAIVVDGPAGRYTVCCDEVRTEAGGARRTFIELEAP